MSAFELVARPADHRLRAIVFATPALSLDALRFALSFPQPAVADATGAAALLASPVRRARFQSVRELYALFDAIASGDEMVGTLIVDSLSHIYDLVTHSYIDISDKIFFRKRQDAMTAIMLRAEQLPCHVVFLAREKTLYARAGEVVGGVVVGPDDNVVVGGIPDTDRTNEYAVDMVARIIAKDDAAVVCITASRMPEISAGLELPCTFEALALRVALAAPTDLILVPVSESVPAVEPTSAAAEPVVAPIDDSIPFDAGDKPLEPSQTAPIGTATPAGGVPVTPARILSAVGPLVVHTPSEPAQAKAQPVTTGDPTDEGEHAFDSLRKAFATLLAARKNRLGDAATQDPRFASLSSYLQAKGILNGAGLSLEDVPLALQTINQSLSDVNNRTRQIQPPSHLAAV